MKRLPLTAGLLLAPVIAVGLLLALGGLRPTALPGLPDPGALTRYGLPVLQPLRDLAAALTVGALVLAACCLPADDPTDTASHEKITGARRVAVQHAASWAAVWCWTNLAMIPLSYSDADGSSVLSPGTLGRAVYFAQNYELGRYLLSGAVLSGIVVLIALRARRVVTLGLATLVSLAALWPMALTGHASGTLAHEDSVNLQAIHLLGISVWVGGIAALVVVRRSVGAGLATTVRRYSTLAGLSLLLVSVSGLAGAWLRLPSASALASSYGVLLGLKVAAITALAALGWVQRRRLIARLESGDDGAFWRIAALEVLVLAAAVGVAVALSRTAPPGDDAPLSTNQAILGYDMPPPLGAAQWFTQWRPDLFWGTLAVLGLVWYLGAVRRLRTRGDSWPLLQTLAWSTGCLLMLWATSGAPGAYSRVLFSMHMVQHMTIATAVPVFLVLGAPVTLALRTLSRRRDGSMGPREWVLRTVHSPLAYLLGHPVVAAGMFVVSLVAFYYSSLFELSLSTHTGHLLMVAHFLLSGYLLANCLVGLDPGPERPPFPLRALLVMVTFGFHAFFSVSLMASNQVLAAGWFDALDRDWGRSPLDDQYLGASIGWALGDYPLAILAGVIVALWVASDRRERRRLDRRADRDGDRDLVAYNAYLASLDKSSRR